MLLRLLQLLLLHPTTALTIWWWCVSCHWRCYVSRCQVALHVAGGSPTSRDQVCRAERRSSHPTGEGSWCWLIM